MDDVEGECGDEEYRSERSQEHEEHANDEKSVRCLAEGERNDHFFWPRSEAAVYEDAWYDKETHDSESDHSETPAETEGGAEESVAEDDGVEDPSDGGAGGNDAGCYAAFEEKVLLDRREGGSEKEAEEDSGEDSLSEHELVVRVAEGCHHHGEY